MIRTLGALLALLAACAPAPSRDPAVVQDVVEYVARIKQWAAVEERVLKAYGDVRESQYVDDDYVIATLGSVMDDIEIHIEQIERYTPRTPAVAKVHQRYLSAWHGLHDGFAATIEAMKRKDYLALSSGTEAMRRSRSELVTVAAALNLLLKDAGLKGEESEEEPS
jgi:hypothetical protein